MLILPHAVYQYQYPKTPLYDAKFLHIHSKGFSPQSFGNFLAKESLMFIFPFDLTHSKCPTDFKCPSIKDVLKFVCSLRILFAPVQIEQCHFAWEKSFSTEIKTLVSSKTFKLSPLRRTILCLLLLVLPILSNFSLLFNGYYHLLFSSRFLFSFSITSTSSTIPTLKTIKKIILLF